MGGSSSSRSSSSTRSITNAPQGAVQSGVLDQSAITFDRLVQKGGSSFTVTATDHGAIERAGQVGRDALGLGSEAIGTVEQANRDALTFAGVLGDKAIVTVQQANRDALDVVERLGSGFADQLGETQREANRSTERVALESLLSAERSRADALATVEGAVGTVERTSERADDTARFLADRAITTVSGLAGDLADILGLATAQTASTVESAQREALEFAANQTPEGFTLSQQRLAMIGILAAGGILAFAAYQGK